MKIPLFIFTLIFSLSSFACINLKAVLNLNGKELFIDQKVDHDKTYSFMKDEYLVHVILPGRQPKNTHMASFKIDRKLGQQIERVAAPGILVRNGHEAIVSVERNETKEKYEVKLTVKNI